MEVSRVTGTEGTGGRSKVTGLPTPHQVQTCHDGHIVTSELPISYKLIYFTTNYNRCRVLDM